MNKRKICLFIAAIILLVASILYMLADRYLIEHLEVKVSDHSISGVSEESQVKAVLFLFSYWVQHVIVFGDIERAS